jgi:hypothetical protein
VKQFLVNYCVEQKLAGYVMVQDPLAIFYEALCVGLDWDEDPLPDDFFQLSPTNSGNWFVPLPFFFLFFSLNGEKGYMETKNRAG